MDATKLIDEKIASLHDWRGERMRQIRTLIHQVEPQIVEEWKWMGSPVFNCDGIVCVLNPHKETVRMTFPKGAKLADPRGVFNSELAGNARRAVLWKEGDPVDAAGLKDILRAAIALNQKKPAARKPDAESSVTGYLPGSRKPATKKAVKSGPKSVAKSVAKEAAVKGAVGAAPKKRAASKR